MRIVAIVAALAVWCTSLATAQAFRCGSEDDTHARCCCPDEPEPSDTPSMDRDCCCELIRGTTPRADRAAAAHPPRLAPALLVAAPMFTLASVARVAASPPRPRSGAPPPPHDRSARPCSLLL